MNFIHLCVFLTTATRSPPEPRMQNALHGHSRTAGARGPRQSRKATKRSTSFNQADIYENGIRRWHHLMSPHLQLYGSEN